MREFLEKISLAGYEGGSIDNNVRCRDGRATCGWLVQRRVKFCIMSETEKGDE